MNRTHWRKTKTDRVTQNAASIRGAIAAVLTSPAGLAVSFEDLMVYRLEDGTYAVDVDAGKDQRIWKSARDAAEDFEKVRQEMKLGYDFETVKETIHYVRMGRTACDFSSNFGVPGSWPKYHIWTSDWNRVNCRKCIDARNRDKKVHDPHR